MKNYTEWTGGGGRRKRIKREGDSAPDWPPLIKQEPPIKRHYQVDAVK